jgi:isoleucyl-tRNA synthetase
MPENFDGYMLDEAAMEKWALIMRIRQDVNGVLEKARKDGRIGKALEAHVTLDTDDVNLPMFCKDVNLAEVFIVSAVDWAKAEEGAEVAQGTNICELTIGVSEAKGEKCPRCWMHSHSSHADGLCARCAAVVAKLDVEM